MKTIIRRKIKKNKLFEDDAQQQPAQNGQQPAQQGQQSAQNGQHPAQSGDPNAQGAGTDMNLCLQNVQKFITGLYQQIQQQIKGNIEKACPELVALVKDTQNPMAAEAKKVNDALAAFNKAEIKPEDPKTLEAAINGFTNFIASITEFNAKVAEDMSKNGGDQQQGSAQPAQNGQQPAQQQGQPAQQQQPAQESYDINGFGKRLYENLRREHMKQQLGQRW